MYNLWWLVISKLDGTKKNLKKKFDIKFYVVKCVFILSKIYIFFTALVLRVNLRHFNTLGPTDPQVLDLNGSKSHYRLQCEECIIK